MFLQILKVLLYVDWLPVQFFKDFDKLVISLSELGVPLSY